MPHALFARHTPSLLKQKPNQTSFSLCAWNKRRTTARHPLCRGVKVSSPLPSCSVLPLIPTPLAQGHSLSWSESKKTSRSPSPPAVPTQTPLLISPGMRPSPVAEPAPETSLLPEQQHHLPDTGELTAGPDPAPPRRGASKHIITTILNQSNGSHPVLFVPLGCSQTHACCLSAQRWGCTPAFSTSDPDRHHHRHSIINSLRS